MVGGIGHVEQPDFAAATGRDAADFFQPAQQLIHRIIRDSRDVEQRIAGRGSGEARNDGAGDSVGSGRAGGIVPSAV